MPLCQSSILPTESYISSSMIYWALVFRRLNPGQLGMVAHTYNPSIWEKQEDQEFKASLSYIVHLSLCCMRFLPFSKIRYLGLEIELSEKLLA